MHPLERLSEHLGGAAVWAKREDCNTGLAYGGNKTRKLEYLIPDALAQGADTLVSIGGVQSNHTRQVAAVAARLGLKAVLVQESWVDWPDAVNDKVGNILLSRIMGADVRLDPAGFGIGFKDSWQEALDEVRRAGGTPYAIPAGLRPPARRPRLRQLGLEVQSRSANSASSSTRSSSAASPEHPGRHDRRLRRPGPSPPRPRHRRIGQDRRDPRPGERIARNTAELIGLGRDLSDDEITVLEGWAGDYYGVPVESTLDAIRLTGRLEGVIIDPVYEGKSMAGLIDLVSAGAHPRGLQSPVRAPGRSTRTQRLQWHLLSGDASPTPSDDPSQVRVGPGADDPRRPRGLVLPGEQMVGAFERDEAAGVAGRAEDLAGVGDADGVVGG